MYISNTNDLKINIFLAAGESDVDVDADLDLDADTDVIFKDPAQNIHPERVFI